MNLTFEKPVTYKLKEELGIHQLAREVADFDYHRRLQGVFNVLFGITVGVLVVMVIVL